VLARTGYTTERDPDTVRTPDISFISYDRLRDVSPALAVEVLSRSDTPREIERKITEYFAKGARLVWIADPAKRTVAVHAPDALPYMLGRHEVLDGGDVLPGFRVAVNTFFGWPPRDPRR
jgi:Uma2 family endonuclease